MSARLIDLLMRLYPRSFRARYGPEVRAVLVADLCVARSRGMGGVAGFWIAAVRDAVEAGIRLHVRGNRRRDVWAGTTPQGVGRRNGGGMVNGLGSDIRFAGRSFRRQPGFHGLAVLTVALGVAATTAVFSVLDGVVRRPLPYPSPHRLVQVSLVMRHNPEGVGPLSDPDILAIAERARTLEGLAAIDTRRRIETGEGDPRSVNVAQPADGFFELLGARSSLGRLFRPEDHETGASPVIVLPFATWTTVHGRDPAILGKTVPLDGRDHEIIGVLAEDFIPPDAVVSSPDYWVPRSLDPNARGTYGALAIGRLAEGSSVAAADVDVRGIIEQAYAEEGASFVIGAKVRDLRVATIGDVGPTLWVLMGGVALLLAIGCMNVANLMLVRSSDRSGEVALRTAMGATRRRIARQLVTESVVVALIGGALGALLAHLFVSAFLAWGPGGIPRLAEVSLDGRALGFALAVSALTGIGFGLVPAIRSAQVAPARVLVSGRHSAPARVGRLRSGLVVAETAMALVLVLAAGLLVNSFVRMRTVDPGFEVDGLVTARVELRTGRRQSDRGHHTAYEESSSWLLFWDRVLAATKAIPGVRNAAITAFVPFLDFPLVQSYTPEGHDIAPDESVFIVSVPTTADFAETLGLRIVQGRDFDGTERAGGEEVILVSETLARTYWPGESSVIGRRIKSGSLDTEDEGWYTVIGVIADARHNLADPPAEIVYHPLQQQPWRQLSILARTSGSEGPVLDALRDAIRSIDPGLPVRSFGTIETLASESVVQPRFYSGLAAGFGALALVLAMVGIYGTTAYATSRRAREIGIRIALGAEKRSVLAMLTFEAARLALFGIALGVPASIASMRLLEAHLFGIAPTDPATFIVVSTAVALTASLAAWLPARRAAGVDPMATLRSDV